MPTGQLAPGNIDLSKRPTVVNPDGSISTLRSISINEDGREVLIPTIAPDGRHLSNDQAIALYRQTGQHLGVFDSPQSATTYAQQLSEAQGNRSQKAPSLYERYMGLIDTLRGQHAVEMNQAHEPLPGEEAPMPSARDIALGATLPIAQPLVQPYGRDIDLNDPYSSRMGPVQKPGWFSTIYQTILDPTKRLREGVREATGTPPESFAPIDALGLISYDPNNPGSPAHVGAGQAGVLLPGAVRAAEEAGAAVGPAIRTSTGRSLAGQAFGDLASTLEPTGELGKYQLRTPTIDRVDDLRKIGRSIPSASNWEGSQADQILQAFGGDREAAIRWARSWGAVSPGTSVPVSTKESISALLYALEHPGVPYTQESMLQLPTATHPHLESKIGLANTKFANLNRAVAGEPLGGDKAEAMAGFMVGQERKPLDVHALYGLGSQHTKWDEELPALRKLITGIENPPARGPGRLTNTHIYYRYEDALTNALREIEPSSHTNPTFAEFWEGVRGHKGLKAQGGPIDILRKKGLLEMGAMLDPQRLRLALRSKGWTAGAIAAVMAGIGSSASDAEPTP